MPRDHVFIAMTWTLFGLLARIYLLLGLVRLPWVRCIRPTTALLFVVTAVSHCLQLEPSYAGPQVWYIQPPVSGIKRFYVLLYRAPPDYFGCLDIYIMICSRNKTLPRKSL